jgi:hypothetical protein
MLANPLPDGTADAVIDYLAAGDRTCRRIFGRP